MFHIHDTKTQKLPLVLLIRANLQSEIVYSGIKNTHQCKFDDGYKILKCKIR